MKIIPSVALGVHIEQTKCIYGDAIAKSRVYVLAEYYSFKVGIEGININECCDDKFSISIVIVELLDSES